MKRLDTKKRILNAALSLFSSKGFLGATTKEIASMAGVAEVTLFRYFPTKESLLEGVIREYSFLPELKGLIGRIEGLSYEDALREIAVRFLDTLSKRKDLIRIMFSEIPLYPSKTRQIHHDFHDEMLRTLASYFDGLKKKGILRDIDVRLGARAFLGLFFSFFISQELCCRKDIKKSDLDTLITEYIEIFARGTLK